MWQHSDLYDAIPGLWGRFDFFENFETLNGQPSPLWGPRGLNVVTFNSEWFFTSNDTTFIKIGKKYFLTLVGSKIEKIEIFHNFQKSKKKSKFFIFFPIITINRKFSFFPQKVRKLNFLVFFPKIILKKDIFHIFPKIKKKLKF